MEFIEQCLKESLKYFKRNPGLFFKDILGHISGGRILGEIPKDIFGGKPRKIL